MSQQLVQQFLNDLDRLRKLSGSLNEQTIREAFKDLLKAWARQNDLLFAAELEYVTPQKTKVYPDGSVLHDLRVPLGFWEAKDTKDDLDEEIRKKFARGYPQDNIIFENSETAVLIQNRQEAFRCQMADTENLLKLLSLFFGYERAEIAEFRKAVEQFKADLPHVLEALREKINDAYEKNSGFQAEAKRFLAHIKETVNPTLGEADVREMLIQHILTEEIFAHVFNEGDFHRDNNIARELYRLEGAFFTGAVKKETLKTLEPYYAAIRANAAQISGHNEKQAFLKVIYENFYKVYNPKAADRLGVVYTPNEIVRFMIEGADWLTQKHFGRALIDPHVEILDPATGTGTFICELIEYFRGQPEKLAQKYKHELHANEVAILPYYVANLNIEATYAAVSGQFAEYPNLCFVDTLDNIGWVRNIAMTEDYDKGLRGTSGAMGDLLAFAALSTENIERVKRQNNKRISVIIGNPPYNANQQNENDNNKNRNYDAIDRIIRATYIRQSTAQKTKVYDMYSRFYRWASDRLHDDGVLALITNRSFIDSRTFDGFRRSVADEFSDIYVVDLGGDIRANPKLSGTKHNVFGIQTGVAIAFMVKRKGAKGSKIFYTRRPEFDTAEDKLSWLAGNPASQVKYERVEPDKNANWINLTENEWDDLIPVADKKTKAAKTEGQERAIFRLYSLGVASNRDEWVHGFSKPQLEEKILHLITAYQKDLTEYGGSKLTKDQIDDLTTEIKWTRSVKRSLQNGKQFALENGKFVEVNYRPFVKTVFYRSDELNEMPNLTKPIFGFGDRINEAITIMGDSAGKPYFSLAIDRIPDLNFVSPASGGTQTLPRYRYTPSGEKIDNITDWALKRFREAYGKGGMARPAISPLAEEMSSKMTEGVTPQAPNADQYPPLPLPGHLPRKGEIGFGARRGHHQGRHLSLYLWRAA